MRQIPFLVYISSKVLLYLGHCIVALEGIKFEMERQNLVV